MLSAFSYGPGAFQYEVVTDAEITQRGDSADLTAFVKTASFVTLRLDRQAGDSLRAQVTLDSVFAERDSLVPAPNTTGASADTVALAPNAVVFNRDTANLPRDPGGDSAVVAMRALIGVQGIPLDGVPSAGDECTASDRGELLEVARDLLVQVPRSLRVGATWADTSTVAICRGGVPVTSGVVRTYEVLDPRRAEDGTPLTRLARITAFSMAGTHTTEYGQVIALSGNGESRAVLELDAAAGVVRSVTREGTSAVTVTYGRTSSPFTQRVVQSVRLLRVAP